VSGVAEGGASAAEIAQAAEILRAGGLVAFPTETVYGLGADASNAAAVRRIFAAKGRPADHPVIVHVLDPSWLPRFARQVPEAAERLAARFWPGPLTLILPRAPGVPDVVTGGQDTVGLRVPAHPVARALLAAFGGGIAAPSANRFGRISPTRAEHVRAELGAAVDMVLEGGACEVGVESTIVDLVGAAPAILRPGRIRPEDVAAALGRPVPVAARSEVRAPGTLESHYAPATPLRLVAAGALAAEALAAGGRAAVLAREVARPAGLPPGAWVTAPGDPEGYERALYAALRDLDALGRAEILVEAPPPGEAWLAVRDRLGRAAHRETGRSRDDR
jgi:L-threonylcarbamoyladenylate synthase